MGTKANAHAAMLALIHNVKPPTAENIYVGVTEYRPNPNGNVTHIFPTIYSYGPHFPLVVWDTRSRDFYVNNDGTTQTTATQRAGVREALKAAGYTPNGIVWYLAPVDHHFEGWSKGT